MDLASLFKTSALTGATLLLTTACGAGQQHVYLEPYESVTPVRADRSTAKPFDFSQSWEKCSLLGTAPVSEGKVGDYQLEGAAQTIESGGADGTCAIKCGQQEFIVPCKALSMSGPSGTKKEG